METGFNPLLHGAASATRGWRVRFPRLEGCFNPLLHGAASATLPDRLQLRRMWPVSIPYFTGRPLQPSSRGRWIGGSRSSFNPLLHGAASAPGCAIGCPRAAPSGFNPLLHGAASATPIAGVAGLCFDQFQSPTSRGGLCNCHSELGQPSLASPEEPVVVVSSSGSNSEGGGQPPLSRGHFEVDHLVGVIHSFNLISKTMLYPSKLMVN